MLSRFVNLIGLVLSVLTAVVINYWGLNLSDLKVEKLPVIKALEGDIRRKPSKDSLDESSLNQLSSNPLRILDSKNPKIKNLLKDAPMIESSLSDDSRYRFFTIKRRL